MGHRSSLPTLSSPHDYLLISINLIKYVGLIPLNDKQLIYTLFIGLLVSIQLVTQFLDLYYNFGDLNAVATNLPTSGLVAVSVVRLIKFTVNRKSYYDLLQEVYISFSHNDQYYRLKRKFTISITYYVTALSVLGVWLLLPASSGGKEFPYRAWYPFKIEGFKTYALLYSFQCTTLTAAVLIIIGTDVMYMALIQLSCIQLEVISIKLQNYINSIPEINSRSRYNEYFTEFHLKSGGAKLHFGSYVQAHCHLLRRISRMESLHSIPMFATFSLQLLILTFLSFETITVSASVIKIFKLVYYITISLIELYLLSNNGDLLLEAEVLISSAIVDSQWFEKLKYLRHNLVIIILRAQKPQPLTVGKIARLSKDTFLETISRVLSLLAVLRQIKNKE